MENFYLSADDEVLFDEDLNVIENYKKFPYMLFHSLTIIFPMVKYEEELKHINDYVYYNKINLNCILNEMKSKTESARLRGEKIIFRESDEITWKWLIETVDKCNNIVLFLSFIEGALKEICNWFAELINYTPQDKLRGLSNIEYYISEIGNCCNYNISPNIKTELEIIRTAKKVRNIFVHEWDAYYNKQNRILFNNILETFKITDLIDSISKILYFCEYAGLYGNVLEKETNDISKAFIMTRVNRIKEEFPTCKITGIIDKYFDEN